MINILNNFTLKTFAYMDLVVGKKLSPVRRGGGGSKCSSGPTRILALKCIADNQKVAMTYGCFLILFNVTPQANTHYSRDQTRVFMQ